MEKKYIIFTPNISYIGGAQLYVRNKCRYVEKKGWNPIIIAGNANNIMIKDLKKYLYIEENEINDPFLERKKQLVFRLMRFLNKHINNHWLIVFYCFTDAWFYSYLFIIINITS